MKIETVIVVLSFIIYISILIANVTMIPEQPNYDRDTIQALRSENVALKKNLAKCRECKY